MFCYVLLCFVKKCYEMLCCTILHNPAQIHKPLQPLHLQNVNLYKNWLCFVMKCYVLLGNVMIYYFFSYGVMIIEKISKKVAISCNKLQYLIAIFKVVTIHIIRPTTDLIKQGIFYYFLTYY